MHIAVFLLVLLAPALGLASSMGYVYDGEVYEVTDRRVKQNLTCPSERRLLQALDHVTVYVDEVGKRAFPEIVNRECRVIAISVDSLVKLYGFYTGDNGVIFSVFKVADPGSRNIFYMLDGFFFSRYWRVQQKEVQRKGRRERVESSFLRPLNCRVLRKKFDGPIPGYVSIPRRCERFLPRT